MTKIGSNEIVQTSFDYGTLTTELQGFIKVKAEARPPGYNAQLEIRHP